MRKTLARRVAQKLIVALVFFLEGECAFAQDWNVIASYGQASASRPQGFYPGLSFYCGVVGVSRTAR